MQDILGQNASVSQGASVFGIRKICLGSGRRLLLYQLRRRMMKLFIVIIKVDHVISIVQNFIRHPSLKVESIHGQKCRASSVWVAGNRSTTDQFFFFGGGGSDTGELITAATWSKA
jgi:hypothetical protein